MTFGEKLRHAREEAGLSQRQLAGEEMTRNMLSQLEHDTARPSMRSLQYLARRLGKSVSYFLEEEGDQNPLEEVRALFEGGQFRKALEQLENIPESREGNLLWNLCALALAREAVSQRQLVYARQLLQDTRQTPYWTRELEAARLLQLYLAEGSSQPPVPEDIWVDALVRCALERDQRRAAALLDAFPRQDAPWCLARGQVHEQAGEFSQAVDCYLRCAEKQPRQVLPRLENCYRELGDYQKAYACAVKLRQLTGA